MVSARLASRMASRPRPMAASCAAARIRAASSLRRSLASSSRFFSSFKAISISSAVAARSLRRRSSSLSSCGRVCTCKVTVPVGLAVLGIWRVTTALTSASGTVATPVVTVPSVAMVMVGSVVLTVPVTDTEVVEVEAAAVVCCDCCCCKTKAC